MKCCPNCGYTETLKNKQMLQLFAKYFPDMPIMNMLNRGWIQIKMYSQWGDKSEWHQDEIPQMLKFVSSELMKFFGVDTEDELKEICGWTGELLDFD